MSFTAIAFLPGLFLHMFYPIARKRHRRYAKLATRLAYGLGALLALLVLFGEATIEGVIHRGAAGANLIDPVFNPRIVLLAAIWVMPALLAANGFLLQAAQTPGKPRVRANANRLLFPWVLLLASDMSSAIAIFFPQTSADAGLRVKMLGQSLNIDGSFRDTPFYGPMLLQHETSHSMLAQ